VQQALSAASTLERSGLTSWDVGTLPREVASGAVRGFPALVDEGSSVALRVLGTPAEQAAVHWRGVRRLLLLTLPSPVKALQGRLTNVTKLALTRNPAGSVAAVLDDCAVAAADALMGASGGVVWDAEGFERLREAVRPKLVPALEEVLTATTGVLSAWYDLRTRLDAEQRPALATSVADMRAQLDRLVHPGFVTATGFARLADVARYLSALDVRLRKLPEDPARDRLWTAQVARVQAEVDDVARRVPPSPGLEQVRWMVEELRISLFAQPMRTRGPVSDKRIGKALDALLP